MSVDRVLIVGLGSIGARHARCARQLLPSAEITVLRHRECGDLTGTGIDRCVTSIADALRYDPQVAVVANPATHHLAAATALSDAGVHLLVEKPIAAASEGVETWLNAARTRGVVVMVGYNLRFHPSLVRFRAELRERRIGRIYSVHAEIGQYLPDWRPGTDYRRGVTARAELGGGVLLELSHELDYLRWVFGEIESVTAVVRRQSSLEIDVADTAAVLLTFCGAGGEAPVVGTLTMDILRRDTTRRCTAIGEFGTLQWDALPGTVSLYSADAGWSTLESAPVRRDDVYLAEWRHFLESAERGSAPLVTGDDGLAVLRVIEAAQRSSTTETAVHLHATGLRR